MSVAEVTQPGALPADHPFLDIGSCRRFEVAGHGASAALVASLDPRQRAGGRQVGAIGFISLAGAAQDSWPLLEAIDAAMAWLAGQGARIVRCPMQLSTWYGHRAVVGRFAEEGGEPPFLLEPRNSRLLPETLRAAGFCVAFAGMSHVARIDGVLAGTSDALARAEAAGYRDRPVRLDRVDAEIDLLHRLSSEIFVDAWAFSPATAAEFAYLYRRLIPIIDADLVRILEDPAGAPIGFAFAVPDLLGPPAGRSGARFVFKTIGVLRAAREAFPGLGSALIARIHGLAAAKGYEAAIHAQVAAGSYAQRLSARWSHEIRRYATFEREA